MEKFWIESDKSSDFNGLKIIYDYFEEGIEYAVKNKIDSICIWDNINRGKRTANFELLKKVPHLRSFHYVGNLSSRSNIDGIYALRELQELRWAVNQNFELDFSLFNNLVKLNVGANHQRSYNLAELKKLKELYIESIKRVNCNFLSGLASLEKIRIIKGDITSTDGLEYCFNLRKVRIVKCNKLVNIDSLIQSQIQLDELIIEKCKELKLQKEKISKKIPKLFIK